MNPASDQLQLRDIHLPDTVSSWPPAMGWWLVLLLIILLLFLLPKLIAWIKYKPIKKIALHEFDALIQEYKNSAELLPAISAFLRQVSMTYKGRTHAASLTGDDWIKELQSLNEQNALPQNFTELLKQGPYQKNIEFNHDDFIQHCRQWLLKLPRKQAMQSTIKNTGEKK